MSSIILNSSIAVESMDKGHINKLEGQKIQAEKSSNVETSKESNANQKVEQNTKAEKNVTPDLTNEQLKMVAQQLQDFMGEMNKGLLFSVDKDSGRDVIKVIDKKNGDLIKQYPTEQVLEMVSKLSDATGSLVNEKI